MAVRVKIEIHSVDKDLSVLSTALLNSGFESEIPLVLVPAKVAEHLGFLPQLPVNAVAETYEAAGGSAIRVYSIENVIKVRVVTDDRETDFTACSIIISEGEREVILSDLLIDELEIIIEKSGVGLWRFNDEGRIRSSLQPQHWE